MQQLGKYNVIRRLGVGGMAEVFLCKLTGIGGFEKHVVLKKIRADIASMSGRVGGERRREVRTPEVARGRAERREGRVAVRVRIAVPEPARSGPGHH